MRLTGLLLLFFSAMLAVSCASSPEEEPAEQPDFFRGADFVSAMGNIAGALRDGRVFIRDTEGYNRVFGFDNFRFTEKNVRPVSIFFLPETNRFHCAALVRDSGSADRPYQLVFFTGAAAQGAPLSLVGVGKAERMYQRPPAVLPEPSVLRAVCEAMREKLRSGAIVWDREDSADGDGLSGKGDNAVRKEKSAFYFLERDWWRAQPRDYVKKKNQLMPLARVSLRRYPAMIDAMEHRHEHYNEELEYIRGKEERGELFVIRPPKKIEVSKVERDRQRLLAAYRMGRETMKEHMRSLERFLK